MRPQCLRSSASMNGRFVPPNGSSDKRTTPTRTTWRHFEKEIITNSLILSFFLFSITPHMHDIMHHWACGRVQPEAVLAVPCSPFLVPRSELHPRRTNAGFGEFVSCLSYKDETLATKSAGCRTSIYGRSTHSNCLHDTPQK